MIKYISLFLMGVIFSACQEDTKPVKSFTYTFEEDKENWQGDFADYPREDNERFELQFTHSRLPAPLDTQQYALRLSGSNLSDDLFMFLKRKITGLKPNTTYRLTFDITLASDAPEQSAGIGGSPGASVFLKAGATTTEPHPIEGDLGYPAWVMNIDKGNQSQGGADMQVLGHVGTQKEEFEYTLINRNNKNNPFTVTTDQNGNIWVIIGTDSGFEGKTTLYYQTITLNFQ